MSWYVGLFTNPTDPGKPKRLENKADSADARKRAILERDLYARGAAASVLAQGRSGTMLTGQEGVTGQAVTAASTLLGG